MISKKRKVEMMQSLNSMFFNGNTNYKLPILKDHVQAECHEESCQRNACRASVISLPKQKITQTIPEDLAMKKCVKKNNNK